MRAIVMAMLPAACGGPDPGAVPTEERVAEFCADYCACRWVELPDNLICNEERCIAENCTEEAREQCRLRVVFGCASSDCPSGFSSCVNSQLDAVEDCLAQEGACFNDGATSCRADNPC